MSRSDQKKVLNQSMANSATDQAAGAQALSGATKAIGDTQKSIADYNDFANQTYGKGGTFLTAGQEMANDVSQAGQSSLNNDLALNAQRTGENTAGYATARAGAGQKAAQDLTKFNAGEQQMAADKLDRAQQFGVEQTGKIPGEWNQIYGASIGGANNSLGTAEQAAKEPGLFDRIVDWAAQGGNAYANASR